MPKGALGLKSYYGRPLPNLSDLGLVACYLCGEALGEAKDTDRDHVIPQKLYATHSINRPYLPVHKHCNHTKSLQDEKFALRVALSAHRINPSANTMVSEFLAKVSTQRQDAYLVGRGGKVRDYKLSRTIARGMSKRLEIGTGANTFVEVDMGEENASQQNEYAVRMVQGLFMRNVKNTQPTQPHLRWLDFQLWHNHGKLTGMLEHVATLRKAALQDPNGFGQMWPGRVAYEGVAFNDKPFQGFIYVEFFNAIGIFAEFPKVE
jgi:hypothetical protein